MKNFIPAVAIAVGIAGCNGKVSDETLRVQKTVLSATQTCLSIKKILLEGSSQFHTSVRSSTSSVIVGRTNPDLTRAMRTLGMVERGGEQYHAVEDWDKDLFTKQEIVSLLVEDKLAGCAYDGGVTTPIFFGRMPSASEQLSHQINNPYISFSSTPYEGR